MEVSRSWTLRYRAAALLRATIVIIRVMQWLYNHRLIGYRATHYFFVWQRCLNNKPIG
jgi:hypothetical protein